MKEQGRFIECEATGHDSTEYIYIRENCNSCDCNTLTALFQLSMLHHIATTSNRLRYVSTYCHLHVVSRTRQESRNTCCRTSGHPPSWINILQRFINTIYFHGCHKTADTQSCKNRLRFGNLRNLPVGTHDFSVIQPSHHWIFLKIMIVANGGRYVGSIESPNGQYITYICHLYRTH